MIDRPISDADLDRIGHLNEFLHQLTACVNPRQRRSPEADADLVRAIIESASLYGLGSAVRRALKSAAGTFRPSHEVGEKMHPSVLLRDVVMLGGLALEAEDCRLRAAVQIRGKHGGLVRNQNERYYQFLVWHAILAKWNAVTEKGGWDLIVSANGEDYFFQLKNWRGKTGNAQFPSMRAQVSDLRSVGHGFYVIISDNPPSETDANLLHLANMLQLPIHLREEYRFPTYNEIGDRYEFWIAGWRVPPTPPPQ